MTKRIAALTTLLVLCTVLFSLAGCVDRQNSETETLSDSEAAGKVAVVSWEDKGADFYESSKMMGDTLYYVDARWEESSGRMTHTSICRKQRGLKEEEQVTGLEDAELILYMIDENESVYCLYKKNEEGQTGYFFRKVSVNGEVIYDTPIRFPGEEELWAVSRLETVFAGEVSREGEICLANTSGDLYLLDGNGRLSGLCTAPWNEESYNDGGLVNAGDEGLFTYLVEDRKVFLQKVDMADGKLGSLIEVQADGEDNIVHQNTISLEVFSGYDLGILISDSDFLWQYNVLEQRLAVVLSWGGTSVNLKNYVIEAIGILQDGTLYARVYRSRDDRGTVHIDFRDEAEVQEKQVVTLAVIDETRHEALNSELEDLAGAFNRVNMEFKVELLPYTSTFDLHTALLKGDGPDIFDFSRTDISILARKGVVQDLSPYFAESTLVKEDDLLPSIRRAGTIGGRLVCIFPNFMVEGLLVEKGTTKKGGWTPEEYVALGEAYPDAVMGDWGSPEYYRSAVLEDAIKMDMESYVNWEDKECYFKSERFISLVNRVNEFIVPKTSDLVPFTEYSLDIVMEKFLNKEILVHAFTCSSIEGFHSNKVTGGYGGDFAEMAGYPNQSGKPNYGIRSYIPLGMNSASKNKEGAWAFLEFVLSEQYQSEVDQFPVRKDCFDRQMELTELYDGMVKLDISEEERKLIRYMVDNAYWPDTIRAKNFLNIVIEETKALWSGDKTAEEVAEIIQSRISLYISEQAG